MDGAHTPVSVSCAASWFAGVCASKPAPGDRAAMLFFCSTDRDKQALLRAAYEAAPQLCEAVFCPPISSPPSASSAPASAQSWVDALAHTWTDITQADASKSSPARAEPTLAAAEERLRALAAAQPPNSKLREFVIGSFYLVGDVLKHTCKWSPDEYFASS